MTARQIAPGGRTGARRFAFPLAATLCMLLAAPPLAAAGDDRAGPPVSVREEGGVYTVTATFTVPVPASIARTVLTDYEGIPRFMPAIRTSIVRERSAGRVVVEQEATASVMMFSRQVHLLLEISEGLDRLVFRDASGRSFRHYAGSWVLAEGRGLTTITYELQARPAFAVPEFLLKRLLKKDAQQMIQQLRAEMAARAGSTPGRSDELAPAGISYTAARKSPQTRP